MIINKTNSKNKIIKKTFQIKMKYKMWHNKFKILFQEYQIHN